MQVTQVTDGTAAAPVALDTLTTSQAVERARAAIRDLPLKLPPSAAIAGIYARVDGERGVWKAPANVGVTR